MNTEELDTTLRNDAQRSRCFRFAFRGGQADLIECDGKLRPVVLNGNGAVLEPKRIEEMVDLLTDGNERLRADFVNTGSCD